MGAPAKPIEPEILAAISSLVDGTPEIIEAHLPQVFVRDAMQAPGQVLVIVTVERDVERALDKVGAGLGRILPSGRSLDVWPLRSNGHAASDGSRDGLSCRSTPSANRHIRAPAPPLNSTRVPRAPDLARLS